MRPDSNVKAMILAAGAGSRLDPLTQLLPKPLVPIGDKAVMAHVLQLLKRHNIDQVAANLYHLAETIPPHFSDHNIDFVTEAKLSGDAGGLRACQAFFKDGTFVVLMGDIVTDVDLTQLIAEHRKSGAIASIALQEVSNVEQFGIVELDQAGFIRAFREKPKACETNSRLASIGIYVFEPEIFEHIPLSGDYMFGKQLFPRLLELGLPIKGVSLSGYWSDIGTIDSYKSTTFDALDGLVNIDFAGQVQNGVSGTVLLGKNVTIGPNVELIGHVVIGDNCVIESGACLIDSILWSDSRVGSDSYLYECILTTGSDVPADCVLERQETLPNKAVQKVAAPQLALAVPSNLTSIDILKARYRAKSKVKSVAG